MLPKQYTSRSSVKRKDLLAPSKAIPLHRLTYRKVNMYLGFCVFLFTLALVDIYRVEIGGWMQAKTTKVEQAEASTEKPSQEIVDTATTAEKVVVTKVQPTALYAQPTSDKPVAYIGAGQVLNVQKSENDWLAIHGKNGQVFWVQKSQTHEQGA